MPAPVRFVLVNLENKTSNQIANPLKLDFVLEVVFELIAHLQR